MAAPAATAKWQPLSDAAYILMDQNQLLAYDPKPGKWRTFPFIGGRSVIGIGSKIQHIGDSVYIMLERRWGSDSLPSAIA